MKSTATAITGFGVSTGVAASVDSGKHDNFESENITGAEKQHLIEEAHSDLQNSKIKEHLSNRNLHLKLKKSNAFEVVWGGVGTTKFVHIPVSSTGNRESPSQPEIAKYVWADDERDNYVVRHGKLSELVSTGPSLDFSALAPTGGTGTDSGFNVPRVVSEDDYATEYLSEEEHTVSLYSTNEDSNDIAALDMNSDIYYTEVDIVNESVDTTGLANPTAAGVQQGEIQSSCPSDLMVILAEIGACGQGCVKCASLELGNWAAVFACLTCAGACCHLGCCAGHVAANSGNVGKGLCVLAAAQAPINPGAACVAGGCTGIC